ncbi:hypothetical protein HANVADRAFT_52055 [Hanseniaspora valbyensis NRRL Y-1626]|uniref:BZIP domain-containing protein n=1 Tax=Hanseniaspora valbyensis NRRL Y-1626 TaxID=766949 RepID=A0A1B7TFS1_9ASCO|nr:hypothetical protein HANVADRAFT_52055 [Hanseniaspora valbyensis NRRL Y-1626]
MENTSKKLSKITPRKRLTNKIAQKKFREKAQKKYEQLIEKCNYLEKRNKELEANQILLKKKLQIIENNNINNNKMSSIYKHLIPSSPEIQDYTSYKDTIIDTEYNITEGVKNGDDCSSVTTCNNNNNSDSMKDLNDWLSVKQNTQNVPPALCKFYESFCSSGNEADTYYSPLNSLLSTTETDFFSKDKSSTLDFLLSNWMESCNNQSNNFFECMDKNKSNSIDSFFTSSKKDLLFNGCNELSTNDSTSADYQYYFFPEY